MYIERIKTGLIDEKTARTNDQLVIKPPSETSQNSRIRRIIRWEIQLVTESIGGIGRR